MTDAAVLSSKRMTWKTPQAFFDEMNREFKFTLDAAANRRNRKCKRYLGPKSKIAQDALSVHWGKDEVVWLNCPYGRGQNVYVWVKKAYEESLRGATVVMLLAARTDTKWFHEFVYEKTEYRFVKGRLKFDDGKIPATFPSIVVIFRPPAVIQELPNIKVKVKYKCGDALSRLKKMKDESVQCIVTSPPYFQKRDYEHPDQAGMEHTLDEYIEKMVEIFREARRVLADDGTFWLNIGDSFASSSKAGDKVFGNEEFNKGRPSRKAAKTARKTLSGFKSSDLMLVPYRLAMALQADGWYLRNDVKWQKVRPMPESVQNRLTCSHESVFLFAKKKKYYFDWESIQEPSVCQIKSGNGFKRPQNLSHRNKDGSARENDSHWIPTPRRRRDIWLIDNKPNKLGHFAMMPEKLAEICILAGSKPGDTVLDPFAGAFTTCLVSKKLRRNSIGIELNPSYVEIGKKRIREAYSTSGSKIKEDLEKRLQMSSDPALKKDTKTPKITAAEFKQPQLTPAEFSLVEFAMDKLLRAQELTDVPWQVIAAAWYRENSLLLDPQDKAQGGIMCFDPVPASPQLYQLVRPFIGKKMTDTQLQLLSDSGVIKDPQTAFIAAACLMRKKVAPQVNLNASDDLIKLMLAAYNGDKIVECSYVMNNFDYEHVAMMIIGTIPDASQIGGRRLIRAVDKRLGAYPVYLQLKAKYAS